METAIAPVVYVVSTLLMIAIYTAAKALWKSWKEAQAAKERLRVAIDAAQTQLALALKENSDKFAAALHGMEVACSMLLEVEKSHAQAEEKLLIGQMEVTKEECRQLDRLTTSVDVFRKQVFAGKGADSFVEFDEAAAQREYEIQQYTDHGMNREEAEERVSAADIYRKMKVTSG